METGKLDADDYEALREELTARIAALDAPPSAAAPAPGTPPACARCGEPARRGDRFCAQCGAALPGSGGDWSGTDTDSSGTDSDAPA